ncbi:MAG: hypothetical protein AB8B65_05475 [Kordia sp.]|uniref:hypothetical protein n=1 Tax=Kordia sp. TaxID=1965332 RepID=UPI00385DD0A5
MITEKQREKLKKILGYHYTNDVLKILKKRGITNRKGTAYGSSMIRNVFNGLNENKEIENAIMDLFINKQEEKEQQLKARNRILGVSDETDD